MKKNKAIINNGGIYLVVNPKMDEAVLIKKLSVIVTKEISAIQIWDNFKDGQNIIELIRKIHSICNPKNIPLLINNQWEYLTLKELDGVHFDQIPDSIEEIKNKIQKEFIIGLTCGNDLNSVEWASNNNVDYISFCSMFPSMSTDECEIVNHVTVQKARKIFNKSLFLAGGIYPNNLTGLKGLDFDGIAVISGVMSSENPAKTIDEYKNKLEKIK